MMCVPKTTHVEYPLVWRCPYLGLLWWKLGAYSRTPVLGTHNIFTNPYAVEDLLLPNSSMSWVSCALPFLLWAPLLREGISLKTRPLIGP